MKKESGVENSGVEKLLFILSFPGNQTALLLPAIISSSLTQCSIYATEKQTKLKEVHPFENYR